MKKKIWKKEQLEGLNIPDVVYDRIERGIDLLNEQYGKNRDIDNNDGGYYLLYIEPDENEYKEIFYYYDKNIEEIHYLLSEEDDGTLWIDDMYLVNNETSLNIIYPMNRKRDYKFFFDLNSLIYGIFYYVKQFKIENLSKSYSKEYKEIIEKSLEVLKEDAISLYNLDEDISKLFYINDDNTLEFLRNYMKNTRYIFNANEIYENFNVKVSNIFVIPIFMVNEDVEVCIVVLCDELYDLNNKKYFYKVYKYGILLVDYINSINEITFFNNFEDEFD